MYIVAELKTEYAQCCLCLEESQGKSVVFANLPTKPGEYLKENLSSFYSFSFLRRKRVTTSQMEVNIVARKMMKLTQMVKNVRSQYLVNKC